MFKKKCEHKWEVVSSQAHPAVLLQNLKWQGYGIPEEITDMVYGFTLRLYKCENCGEEKTEKLTGAWK